MSRGPTEPPPRLDTDEKLVDQGWAAGMDVWPEMLDAYSEAIGSDEVANAQAWSLREAIRQELRDETAAGR